MSQQNLSFNKTNLIICAVAVAFIVMGFILMTGSATTAEHGFEPDIFSSRRIKVAPLVCLIGFVIMFFGLLYPFKQNKKDETKEVDK